MRAHLPSSSFPDRTEQADESRFSSVAPSRESSFIFVPRSDDGAITPLGNDGNLQDRLAKMKGNKLLILLVAQDGDERNASYDPIFCSFAASDRRSHEYARTEDPAVAERYGISDFPTVLIFKAGRAPYMVKDRLAVEKEAAYFTLPTSRQLAHVETRFRSPSPSVRGSAVMAYGLTARETDDDDTLTRASDELSGMFSDPHLAVRDAAVYSSALICERLPATVKTRMLRSLVPLFTDPSPDVAFEAMALCRKTASTLDGSTGPSEITPVTDSLKALFSSPNPDVAVGALSAYAAFSHALSAAEIAEIAPVLESYFADENNLLRWSALFAFGELFPRFEPDQCKAAEDRILSFLNDPYAGVRHRALLIIEANRDRFAADRLESLAPALRATFAEPAQQIDVAELAMVQYARLNARLDAAERALGSATLRTLADDEEEDGRIRETAAKALAELK